jgi:peptide/nickel transport system substrate-binding protein
LFNLKDMTNWEPLPEVGVGFPRFSPWQAVKHTPTAVALERNPYYFKVDKAGNQLPYCDTIRTELVQDVQMNVLKIISGEVDFVSGGAQGASVKDISVLRENEQKAGYRLVIQAMHVCPVDIFLNLTNTDPVWRQVVRDVRFRKALTLGINRPQIIEAVYTGFAGLPKSVPAEYDPDTAKKLLDEMGLNKKDADGFRLGPDGKTFEIPFEVAMHAADQVPVVELVVEFWKALGVKTSMKVIDAGLQGERRAANELKAHVLWNHYPPLWWGAIWDVIPIHWGPAWYTWLQTNGEKGEEPPEEVKKITQLIEQSLVVSQDQRQRAIAEHARLMYDNIFIIYVVEDAKYPTIANKNLFNVPKKGFAINTSFSGEQFFYKR